MIENPERKLNFLFEYVRFGYSIIGHLLVFSPNLLYNSLVQDNVLTQIISVFYVGYSYAELLHSSNDSHEFFDLYEDAYNSLLHFFLMNRFLSHKMLINQFVIVIQKIVCNPLNDGFFGPKNHNEALSALSNSIVSSIKHIHPNDCDAILGWLFGSIIEYFIYHPSQLYQGKQFQIACANACHALSLGTSILKNLCLYELPEL